MSEEKKGRSKFPKLFWLVVMFEFFERGSYYGMMSVLSVYMTSVLNFAKQDVGDIKATIQPLLYFLPILAGALADRFGYRRLLMIAFALLGGGYFLTAQATGYAAVFLSLVVMGLGAGTFKPIISGTIARCTDESNSTLGFGIFYWSINLGAFLFPLFLVPLLRDNIGWEWVIIASAIGTGAMLLPTIFAFREPPKPKEDQGKDKDKTGLLQTLANAFEIVYSPFVLLSAWMRRSAVGVVVIAVLLAGLLGYGGWLFAEPSGRNHTFAAKVYRFGDNRLTVRGEPNLCKAEPYKLELVHNNAVLSLYNPDKLDDYAEELLVALNELDFVGEVQREDLVRFRDDAVKKTILEVEFGAVEGGAFEIQKRRGGRVGLVIQDPEIFLDQREKLLKHLQIDPRLSALDPSELDELVEKASRHSFLLVFVGLLFLGGLVAVRLAPRFKSSTLVEKLVLMFSTVGVLYLLLWLLPGLSLFARILCSILSLTLLSLYTIDYGEAEMDRFKDHFRFLLMVVIYSGFWVLYFQMFDSVLWYVQAYVDPTSLNQAVNNFLSMLGFESKWRFDIEIVTVINAGTIIILQLLISYIVKNIKALPTMIVGIAMGTVGMAILAISTGIWVFMLGICIFSIGEMTAHPKFISYVGQTAPKSRVAMYMGYLFLYGVIGSSIGAPIGANLYVKFVDEMNQPRTLWLIFAGIGVATIIGLLLYNKFVAGEQEEEHGLAA